MTPSRFTRRILFFVLAVLSPLAAQTARLANISTRGQVGTEANILVGGFVISGPGNKTVLIRAIGPGLGAFGVAGTLTDPTLSVFNSAGTVVAGNDNWNAIDAATFTQVGAFPLPANSKDAVVVATLAAGSYTAQISGLGSAPTGVAILEVYDVSGSGQLVNIATRLQVGTGANAAVAGFVISLGSGTRKLLVRGIGPALGGFGVPGTLADPKLTVFDGNAQTIATAVANGSVAALASATAQAGAFASSAGDAATIITVSPGAYTVQLAGNSGATAGVGLIEVYDITNTTGTPTALASPTPRLYYASLRPNTAATSSTASGYATILYDPNTNVATVSVNFSNLSSSATSAHLVVGQNASSGNFVFNLPRSQANALTWTFPASGTYSTTDLITAMVNGQLFVSIDSSNFPGGELQGGFVLTTGSTTFAAPAAPPALAANALTAPTPTDAARFLTQATFGPTKADIDALTAGGITKWIDDQMALPATSFRALLLADVAEFPWPPIAGTDQTVYFYTKSDNQNAAWWKLAATAPDQLRQRVAFALSEIFVIGALADIDREPESKTRYYDQLANGAFGNFRALLENVSLSPVMGFWLTHWGNQKADPVRGTSPDENYAREIMQLFTIGLVQRQPDGTLMLDSSGQPLPTYNQATITETAKIFTGWAFANAPASTTNIFDYKRQTTDWDTKHADDHPWLVPMRYFDAFHDKTAKRVVSPQQVPLASATPTSVPAGQTGPQDLKILLDTLSNHPNVAPFLSRQLIQRLITSNPSPGYVYRVAQVWTQQKDSPAQLGAVVRAILTDHEARSPAVIGNIGYGKIKEPLIRMTALFRALNIRAPNGRYMDSYFGDSRYGKGGYGYVGTFVAPNSALGQEPLYSLSVFNFFAPDYSPPGPLAAAGLVAPEMQITTSSYAINTANNLMMVISRNRTQLIGPPTGLSPYLAPDFSAFLPNARNAAALVDQLNLLLCANSLSAASRTLLLTTLDTLPASATDQERVETAAAFIVISADSATQK